MVVTAGTLLLQGLTLPALVRPAQPARARTRAPTRCRPPPCCRPRATPRWPTSDRIATADDAPETIDCSASRIALAARRPVGEAGRSGDDETPAEQYRRLRLSTLHAERDEVLRIRSSGTVDHDVIEQVLASFDIEESMLTIATERADRLRGDEPCATPADPTGGLPCTWRRRPPRSSRPVRRSARTASARAPVRCTCGSA